MPTPVSVYDALKVELDSVKRGAEHFAASELEGAEQQAADLRVRIPMIEDAIKAEGPKAIRYLKAELSRLESSGDRRARGVAAELERVQTEVGGTRKIERAASVQGGDAGNSRAAR